jgi:Spondin_N
MGRADRNMPVHPPKETVLPRFHRVAPPVAAVAFALFASGCFDDSTTAPSSAAPADDQIALAARHGGGDDDDSSDDGHHHGNTRRYEVTLENLTPATGMGSSQPFSPAILATHDGSVRVFRPGRRASDELKMVAEDAINDPLVDRLMHSHHVAAVTQGTAPIGPGGIQTWTIEGDRGANRLSMVFMLVNTNDGFSGIAGLKLPRHGEVVRMVQAWDAGTEENTEAISDIPGPCCGHPGAGTDTHGRIRPHEGILGVGDLDPTVWGWDGNVARITVKRVD